MHLELLKKKQGRRAIFETRSLPWANGRVAISQPRPSFSVNEFAVRAGRHLRMVTEAIKDQLEAVLCCCGKPGTWSVVFMR